jgi:hypothetical protein
VLVAQDGSNCVHVLIGSSSRVYFAVTSGEYPQRFVTPSPSSADTTVLGDVRELAEGREFGEVSLTCPANGLGRGAVSRLREIATKYNRLEDLDVATRVRGKLEEVKGVMTDNIDIAIKSLDKSKETLSKSENLKDSADRFKRQAQAAERSMACRYYKWTAALVLLVLGVLAAIIVPIALQAQSGSG